jgi:SulP family sulfate permease
MIANMLRRSPLLVTPQPQDNDGQSSISDAALDDEATPNGRLIITSNGLKRDTTERTPLLAKNAPIQANHPDWIHGGQDVEAQAVKRKVSWPKLRDVADKSFVAVKTACNPKHWHRQTILDGIKAPFQFLPAVILGLLLNILDALSYGTSMFA